MATLLDKLWSAHEIKAEHGQSLLWVDRHLVHEGSHHAFAKLAERGLELSEPRLTFGVADHYAPTRNRDRIEDPQVAVMLERLEANCTRHGKDMALHWISQLGTGGATGHAVEYAGSAVRALSMEGRMTLCNLSIEGGARFGMVAPDAVTLAYVKGRPMAPSGTDWDAARAYWQTLHSDADASFDRDVSFDMAEVAPTVTWGTTPDQALPIGARLPDPAHLAPARAEAARDAMDYMGLTPGRPLEGTPVDQVFLGSCTNGRIDDLRAAAAVLRGRRAKVPGQVSPGSMLVKEQAEQEGLDKIFTEAGLEWTGSGCSMCVGMNGDLVGPGKRCASSTNRNFRGRQGKGARTHLMSPAMVAAAAVTGTLTDVRPLLEGRG